MIKTAKIAISLPQNDLFRLEKVRKKLGIQRSAIIDMAIRFWLETMEKRKLIKQYEDGYRNKPEDISEIKAMERAAGKAFSEEEWK